MYAALAAAANQGPTDAGDLRGRGGRMADALVERITGRDASLAPKPTAEATCARTDEPTAERADESAGRKKPPVPVAINLLVPLGALTGDGPAHLEGYGSVPADLAREFLADAGEKLRRVFRYPGTGDLIGMESKARHYPGLLATFARLRDQCCRNPFCGAPIRETDHITPYAGGGPTSERNASSTCSRCNQVKEHPDFHVTGDAGETLIRTGGLEQFSRPPAPSGQPPPVDSLCERVHLVRDWNLRIQYVPAA